MFSTYSSASWSARCSHRDAELVITLFTLPLMMLLEQPLASWVVVAATVRCLPLSTTTSTSCSSPSWQPSDHQPLAASHPQNRRPLSAVVAICLHPVPGVRNDFCRLWRHLLRHRHQRVIHTVAVGSHRRRRHRAVSVTPLAYSRDCLPDIKQHLQREPETVRWQRRRRGLAITSSIDSCVNELILMYETVGGGHLLTYN